MSISKKFIDEALDFLGEQDLDDKKLGDEAPVDDLGAEEDPLQDLDLGAEEPAIPEPTDQPAVRIEKDGDITINKGEIAMTITDDGTIDINFDNLNTDIEPTPPVEEPVTGEGETSAESDAYNIDWEEEEKEAGAGEKKESLEEGTLSAADQQSAAMAHVQSPAVIGATVVDVSKARRLNRSESTSECVRETCEGCDKFNECDQPGKHRGKKADDNDFISQGYL